MPRPLLHLSAPSCHCSNLFLTPRFQALMLIHISPAVDHEQQRMQGTLYHLCLIQPLPDRGHDTVGIYPPHIYLTYTFALASAPCRFQHLAQLTVQIIWAKIQNRRREMNSDFFLLFHSAFSHEYFLSAFKWFIYWITNFSFTYADLHAIVMR